MDRTATKLTPFPNGFKPYVEKIAQGRYFLHSPNSEVRLCRFQNISFIVISEVYGFAVGATTVEELIHHGINTIIAVGYAGAFNDAPVGQPFIAVDTMSDLPLAAHYGIREYVRSQPSGGLLKVLHACIKDDTNQWGHFTVWTSNSLYRESPWLVKHMKDHGCGVVNMDTLSIYAVTPVCADEAKREVGCIYVGTVTDSKQEQEEDWNSNLAEAVKRETAHPHDHLIRFMVETVLPRLD